MSSSIVLIGPADAIPALRERLDSGAEMHTFTDAEALEALDHIIRSKPRIVALDHEFSSTSRGTALINRIKDDPSLVSCEVRVIAHDTALNRVAVRRPPPGANAAIAVDEPKKPLDQRGTRRAPRLRIKQGVEVLVDGNGAALVDLSTVGAQVLSPKMLKPNQRVRMALSDGKGTVRCQGSIAWASFEMPKGQPTRYRAGIDFTATDPEAIAAYAERNKA
ncbi:MAG TPA: PilZ domain-containing protein [Vicinamibacterales bacterium]|nr:PilZ domain-containing protein [Vicinamibacterales bacterium]